MKRFILLTAIFGLVSLSAVAQQQQATLRTIKGYVFNAEGDAMPGATVKAVADSATTKSGSDGTFSIEVTQFVKFLEASYEGYISAQAEIDGTTIIFKLQVDKKYAANKAKAEKAALKAAKIEAAEKAKAAEAARLAAEKEAARLAAEREVAIILAKQEAERLAAEKVKAEEEARLAAVKAKAEEDARLAAAKAKAEEDARLAAEKAKAEEEARLAAEKAKAEEEARLAAEKAKAEEEARLAAERVKAAEEARLAAEKALAEEKSRREAEKAQMNEQIRLAVEKALAEEKARTASQVNSSTQMAPQSVVQQPVQQYAPQQPVQQYAPQQPVQQYAPQQPVQQYAPQQPVQQPNATALNDEAQDSPEKKPKKELKKNRFGQVVEFGYFATTKNMNNIQRFDSAATFYYALGGSFVNNAIFFGVGTGIVYNFAGLTKISEPAYSGGGTSKYPYENIGVLPLADLTIPAYFYFKANMVPKAKVSPFISLMGGAEISPQAKTLNFRYGRTLSGLYQTPIFGRVQLGLSIRLSDRGAMYLGVGYRFDRRWGAYTKEGDSEIYPEYKNVNGFTANLGFTF